MRNNVVPLGANEADTVSDMTCRPAVVADAGVILALCLCMHSEARVAHAPVNETKAMHTIIDAIDGGVVFVAVKNGAIIGSIGGFVAEDWWSDQQILGDLWFYVLPEYRATRAAFTLFRMFKETSDKIGVPLKVGVVNGVDVERKDKFFALFGLIPSGSYYQEGK